MFWFIAKQPAIDHVIMLYLTRGGNILSSDQKDLKTKEKKPAPSPDTTLWDSLLGS